MHQPSSPNRIIIDKEGGIEYSDAPLDDPIFPILFGWGMPSDCTRVCVRYAEKTLGARFKKFSIELYGVAFANEIASNTRDRTAAGGVVYFRGEVGTVRLMHVWMHRLRRSECSLTLERLWHPELGWQTLISGTQMVPQYRRVEQAVKLVSGLVLLESFQDSGQGRPLGSGNLGNVSTDELIAQLSALWAYHEEKGLKAPGQSDLAAQLGISRATLLRRLKALDLDWRNELVPSARRKAADISRSQLTKIFS